MLADVRIAQSLDGVLAAKDDLEESDVLVREEVEAAIRAALVLDVFADATDGFDGHRWIFEAGEEFEVSAVRRNGQLSQVMQAVDALLERRQA
jgi:hypothetical protein